MKRMFEVEVTRIDTYKVEIDDEIINDEWIKKFESYMWELPEGIEDVAKCLATNRARFGSSEDFMEGFGYVTTDSKLPFSCDDYDSNMRLLPESDRRQPTPGLNIIVVSEDDDIDTEIEEIKLE